MASNRDSQLARSRPFLVIWNHEFNDPCASRFMRPSPRAGNSLDTSLGLGSAGWPLLSLMAYQRWLEFYIRLGSAYVLCMLRGSPVQTSLTLNPSSIQLRFGRVLVEVFPVSSQPRNSENGSLAARRNSSRLLGSSLQTETHIVGFPFVTCNTTVQLTLPELLEHPVTPLSSKVSSPSRTPSFHSQPSSPTKILPRMHLDHVRL